MLTIIDEQLNGAKVICPFIHSDHRGSLIKTLHIPALSNIGINFKVEEEYYSISAINVIRGMHFQLPPYNHAKLVYCINGRILDVLVDIRKDSPSFGEYASFLLTQDNCHMVYVPSGMAHGFLSLDERSIVVSKSDTVYAPDKEAGIRWDSFGFRWPCTEPLLSEKDRNMTLFSDFDTPF